jgi:hypothetical protein
MIRYIALHCLALFAKTLGGREAIFEAGPTLRIFKRPFENPALSSDLRVPAVASAVLRLLDEDPRFAPIVVEQGLISCLLNLLLWVSPLLSSSLISHLTFCKGFLRDYGDTMLRLLSSQFSIIAISVSKKLLMLACAQP